VSLQKLEKRCRLSPHQEVEGKRFRLVLICSGKGLGHFRDLDGRSRLGPLTEDTYGNVKRSWISPR